MAHVSTQGERLARIETLLEQMIADMAEIKKDVKKLDEAGRAYEKKLEALENKGKGIAIGIGLAASAMGAAMTKLIERLFH